LKNGKKAQKSHKQAAGLRKKKVRATKVARRGKLGALQEKNEPPARKKENNLGVEKLMSDGQVKKNMEVPGGWEKSPEGGIGTKRRKSRD